MGFRNLMKTCIYTPKTITMNTLSELLDEQPCKYFHACKYSLFLVQTFLIFYFSKYDYKKIKSIKMIMTNVPIDKCQCWPIFFVCVIWKQPIERKQWDLIFKAELPAHYSCADNHRTHELEMTANKLISDQRILLVLAPIVSLKVTTISQEIFVHNNLLVLRYSVTIMMERNSLLYYQ